MLINPIVGQRVVLINTLIPEENKWISKTYKAGLIGTIEIVSSWDHRPGYSLIIKFDDGSLLGTQDTEVELVIIKVIDLTRKANNE